jgi:hypothetical protein
MDMCAIQKFLFHFISSEDIWLALSQETNKIFLNIQLLKKICYCALLFFKDENIDVVRPDAFMVLYSVCDRKSFVTAAEVTQHLRCELGMDRPVMLVATKTDLRRQQKVSAKGEIQL